MSATEYGTSAHGFEFPMHEGRLLSWDIGSYMNPEEERLGHPRARMVIQAFMERRPEQLEREKRHFLKASFDRMFGHNAQKILNLIIEIERTRP